MANYDIMFVCPPDESVADAAIEKYTNLINNNGGSIKKVDRWGIKTLAYDIMDNHKGYYVLMGFIANPACIKELDRVMRIDEGVLRYMIIHKGE